MIERGKQLCWRTLSKESKAALDQPMLLSLCLSLFVNGCLPLFRFLSCISTNNNNNNNNNPMIQLLVIK
jgi:hypothetical protein